MGSHAGDQYRYSADGATIYGTLGIEGTTYEVGYDFVRESLGDGIAGKVFLDFGCGAGRSTFFLKALGAGHVYGVDHDQNMLNLALAARQRGVEFLLISDTIPLPDEAVDGAISLTVFVEIRTATAMINACREVARVLRRGSPFILMSVSPMAFGHTFRSFGYPITEPLHSGDITAAIVTAPGGQFLIEDTYWTEEDYRSALLQAGFVVAEINYPRPHDPSSWSTDEANVPPFIVIKAIKQEDSEKSGGSYPGQDEVSARIRYEGYSSGPRQPPSGLAANRLTSRIYLSSGRDHQAIEEAIERLLRAFDLEIYRKFPEVNGSWFRKFLVHAKQGAPDVEESVIKLVRALELQTLHRPQADIDAKQADAVAKLMNALDKEENAAIQIGSLLLVKVGRNYVVRNLSQLQLAHLESNPELFQNPATVLRQLQGLAVANAHPSMIAREPCPCGSNLPTESCHPGGCR